LTLALATLPSVVGGLPWIVRKAWLVPFAIQIGVLALARAAVDGIVAAATSRAAPFGRYRATFRLVEDEPFEAPRLVALQRALRGQGSIASASREMTSLERILSFGDLRHSGIVHTIANLALLWDVWVALALDRWRRRAAGRVRLWIE